MLSHVEQWLHSTVKSFNRGREREREREIEREREKRERSTALLVKDIF
jgi:hypothetical protein